MSVNHNSYLQAMSLIKADDWHAAHDIIERLETPIAAHIHAYLHRIEGDQWNADYWYRRAGTKRPTCSLDDEWQQIHDLIT